MGFYQNTRCSKCGYSLSGGYNRVGVDSNLGLPFLKCPNCKTVCKTGRNIYSLMTDEERVTYKFGRIKQTLINAFGIAIGLMGLSIITGVVDEDKMEPYPHLVIIGVLGILLSALISYANDKSCIDNLEKAYRNKDKNYYADID
ncbi:MAG: hypothetical protein ACKKL6_00520 [Candidatus Komeilibacteria bacterium]